MVKKEVKVNLLKDLEVQRVLEKRVLKVRLLFLLATIYLFNQCSLTMLRYVLQVVFPEQVGLCVKYYYFVTFNSNLIINFYIFVSCAAVISCMVTL